ncbi:MAG: hypothetical protein ACYSYM_11805, partial [Planctomycetota bacterium]
MQLLDFALSLPSSPLCVLAEVGSISSVTSLPFNPIKLACLVSWIYLCLYFVQRIQFSPLVPHRYKSVAYIVALFAGPILLLLLLIVDTARKSSDTGDGIFETIRQQVKQVVAGMRSARLRRDTKDSTIKLLDSSGRSINEIYGHGDARRQESHIL